MSQTMIARFVLACSVFVYVGVASKSHGQTLSVSTPVGERVSQAVERLAEQLKKHPVKASKGQQRMAVFLMDLERGGVTRIADEPDPGSDGCGSPVWSHDGTRILYDAMPFQAFHKLQMKALECGAEGPKLTDLGPGARPSLSPGDDRIAFLIHDNAVPNVESGVWVMQADGSQRRRAGDFGMPLWSPDGRRFLIVSFSFSVADARTMKVIDLERGSIHQVEIPNYRVFGWPTWAEVGTLVAVVGMERWGDTVALIDISNPEAAFIKKELWRSGNPAAMGPLRPVYSPVTRRCVFIGVERGRWALYTMQADQPGPPKRLENRGPDGQIGGLNFSPDGRYLLFCSTRPD